MYRPQFVVMRFQIGTACHLTRVRVIVTFTRHRQFLIIVHGGAKIFLLINRLRCPHLLQGVRAVGGQNNHRHTAVLGFHHSWTIMGQRRPRCTHQYGWFALCFGNAQRHKPSGPLINIHIRVKASMALKKHG